MNAVSLSTPCHNATVGAASLVIAFSLLAFPEAQAEDLHRLWDQRCGACHGHAGSFARASLELVDGQLRGRRSRKDIATYLVTHNGGYSREDIAAIQQMLTAQVGTRPLFQDKCGACHETATQLVREHVVRDQDRLIGRASGLPLGQFLATHVPLTADENTQLLSTLGRVESEVRRP